MKNVRRRRELIEYAQIFIKAIKSTSMSIYNQFFLIYNNLDFEFQRNFKKRFDENINLNTFLNMLKNKKKINEISIHDNAMLIAIFTRFQIVIKQTIMNVLMIIVLIIKINIKMMTFETKISKRFIIFSINFSKVNFLFRINFDTIITLKILKINEINKIKIVFINHNNIRCNQCRRVNNQIIIKTSISIIKTINFANNRIRKLTKINHSKIDSINS